MKLSTKGLEKESCTVKAATNSTEEEKPLGVSVWHLMTTFKEEVEKYYYIEKKKNEKKKRFHPMKFIRNKLNRKKWNDSDFSNAAINDIEDLRKETGFIRQKGKDVVSKEDDKAGESYVNCLSGRDHVGPSTHMLSYSWSNKILHIISSLSSYCRTNDLDPKRTYIWICCLCINQHRVKEMMVRGEVVPFEKFGSVFEERVIKIGNVLALMVPWKKPIYLTRVWCIFETYMAIMKECNLSIIMPEEEKESLVDEIKNEGTEFLWEVLASTRIENATASVQADKENILKLVESGAGYANVNARVNSRLRQWIIDSIVAMVKKAEEDSNNIATDTDLAKLYKQAGEVFNDNANFDAAIDYSKKSVAIDSNVYGEEHNIMSTTLHNIGDAYYSKGEYNDALEYFTKALSIYRKVDGEENPDTSRVYDNIGACYHGKNKFNVALEHYEKSLSILKYIYGGMCEDMDYYEDMARTLKNMASCYADKGDKDNTLQKYTECLPFYKKVLDDILNDEVEEGDPLILKAYLDVGTTYYQMNKFTDAEKHVKMAINMALKVLGPEHPETLKSKGWYEKILVKLENN